MQKSYHSIKITAEQAAAVARELYGIRGQACELPGDSDFNFRINSNRQQYILKISRPDADLQVLDFQNAIAAFLARQETDVFTPLAYATRNGAAIGNYQDTQGCARAVRLLPWAQGRLWSEINPVTADLLQNLGEAAGKLTAALQQFDHPQAHRSLQWDIAAAGWTEKHLAFFSNDQSAIVQHFQTRFRDIQKSYQLLRKSVVHNDVNDNNIIVSHNLFKPSVTAIIDYGDAVHTQSINDLAIVIAYAIMNKKDVLQAAFRVVNGYQRTFPLQEQELQVLYVLVAMRLVISVTKSAISRETEPDNDYLQISARSAWQALRQWREVNESYAVFRFREACGYAPHPAEASFRAWAERHRVSLNDLFPNLGLKTIQLVDMSVGSTWLGHESDYQDLPLSHFKLQRLQAQFPEALIAGGYLETRPFYSTDAYKKTGNDGPQYRTVHLGCDFWVEAGTAIHAPLAATVFSIYHNDQDKDYGPTLILEHRPAKGPVFYTLFGHLSLNSLTHLTSGQKVEKGQLIGHVGDIHENGNWVPHLHFQVVLDLLGNQHDFPGVAYPAELNTWKHISPDPALLFKEAIPAAKRATPAEELIAARETHLGKSLSLSYQQPLHVVRGSGAFLIDINGQRFLDTVNNVAHVGHEHPRVVAAGQRQMAVLNTNSRYLHKNIVEFSQELLATFPAELAVVHFVNSGSEANELALRMARTYRGQKDMIAVEVGYHGNTGACVDISSYKFDGKGGKGAPPHTRIVPLPDRYRGLYQGKNTGERYADHIAEQIRKVQAEGRDIAGFICESILSCGGQIELPENYLKNAYAAVRGAGGLCIADEVQVGCGRVGSHFWGFQLHGVLPDIVTIGKPIGNGHPLAAVVCTEEVAAAFANGMEYFNTFGGNPVSCAIGLEVLRVIRDERLQQQALEVGNFLKTGLRELQSNYPIIGDVRGQGLFLGFELVDPDKNPLMENANYLANRMREFGILMSTDGRDNNVLKIKPPLVFSQANADELLSRLESVLQEDFMKSYNR